MDLRHKICLAIEYAKQDSVSGEKENWRTMAGMAEALEISEYEFRRKIADSDFSYADFKRMENYLGHGFKFDIEVTFPDGTKI